MMFLILVFAVFDFGHFFFVELYVQNAVQEAARYGSMASHVTVTNPDGTQTTLSRLTSMLDALNSDALGTPFSSVTISSATFTGTAIGSWTWTPGSSTTPPASLLGAAGGPRTMLTLSATTNIPLFTPVLAQMFPHGQYPYTASVTVYNEPFASTSTD
jgi:Flp pilus assembly protein TadG